LATTAQPNQCIGRPVLGNHLRISRYSLPSARERARATKSKAAQETGQTRRLTSDVAAADDLHCATTRPDSSYTCSTPVSSATGNNTHDDATDATTKQGES
jgi:hypothetical protein